MATTERSPAKVTVKEGPPRRFSLMFEGTGTDLSILNGGFVSLGLEPGTTLEQAQVLAASLNRTIASVSLTIF
jgi:hypothetical protein